MDLKNRSSATFTVLITKLSISLINVVSSSSVSGGAEKRFAGAGSGDE
jgi:hypothetical protein